MNQIDVLIKNKNDITPHNILHFLENNSLEQINYLNPPISFNKDENPVSYWNDMEWDFYYNKLENKATRSIIQWDLYKLNDNFHKELKYTILTLYYRGYKYCQDSSFIKKYVSNLSMFLEQCQALGYASICTLSNEINFINLMEKIKFEYAFTTLSQHLNTLRLASEINNPYFPLMINFSSKERLNKSGFNIKELAVKYSKTQSDSINQTLYIPNKIHSKLISTCISFIQDKSKKLDNIMNFLEEDFLLYEKVKKDLNITKYDRSMKRKIDYEKKKEDYKLFQKHHLLEFSSLNEIQKEVRLLSTACSILILNFSGMRINELVNIETDGFKVIESDPRLYVLRSYETKLSGGQVSDYITSPIVKDAFDILNTIHSLAKKYDNTINHKHLFVTSKHQKLLTYGRADSIGYHINNFAKEIKLIIDHDDIKESELLNGPREEIKPGEVWPLASHQFRRTLIVNFVSHRLGTINAVKQQVKHMYATMTEYYAKNSRLAETFNLNVVKEIAESIEEELLNEGVRQYKKFHYSNEPLAGIRGQEIMDERKTAKVLSDNEIKQLFKTGMYKISKSMYGYCTKGNLCDKKEAIDPTFCGASCSTMIITKENAENWQKLYFKNTKILNDKKNLILGGIPMNSSKTTMQSQNEVAKTIMNKFNIKYED